MKNNWIKIIIIVCCLFLIVGCDNKQNNNQVTENKTYNNIEKENNKMIITINNKEYEIILEDNPTTNKLMELLPIDIKMSDLNENEKYVYLNDTFPTDEKPVKDINKGDVMLYGDNCLVIFYKSFKTSYSYTRIGHIKDLEDLTNDSIIVKLRKENNK